MNRYVGPWVTRVRRVLHRKDVSNDGRAAVRTPPRFDDPWRRPHPAAAATRRASSPTRSRLAPSPSAKRHAYLRTHYVLLYANILYINIYIYIYVYCLYLRAGLFTYAVFRLFRFLSPGSTSYVNA